MHRQEDNDGQRGGGRQVAGRRMQPGNQPGEVGDGDEQPERADKRGEQCRPLGRHRGDARFHRLHRAFEGRLPQPRLFDHQTARRQPAADTEKQEDAPARHHRSRDAERADVEEDGQGFHHQYFRTNTMTLKIPSTRPRRMRFTDQRVE